MASDYFFTTELLAKVISELKIGRAPDIDGFMGEHLIKAHPILPVIISKLFRLIVLSRHIPTGFGYSYIVFIIIIIIIIIIVNLIRRPLQVLSGAVQI